MLPCPLCNSTNLSANLWCLDDGEVDAVECNDCYAGAPVTAWQKRWAEGGSPSGKEVLLYYRDKRGRERGPILSMRLESIESMPTIRWTHIPAHDAGHDPAETPVRCEAPGIFESMEQ